MASGNHFSDYERCKFCMMRVPPNGGCKLYGPINCGVDGKVEASVKKCAEEHPNEGEWEMVLYFKCPFCGNTTTAREPPFCPSCGARLDPD